MKTSLLEQRRIEMELFSQLLFEMDVNENPEKYGLI